VDMKFFFRDPFLFKGRNVFGFHGRAQFVAPFGDTQAVPFFERYFLGGDQDLRGFDIRGVSPYAVVSTISKDNEGNPLIDFETGLPRRTDQVLPIGGDIAIMGQAEYRIPIAGPVSLALFADAGISTVTQYDKLGFSESTNVYLISSTNGKWRASTGAELQFMLPMVNAPFRLIFAYNPLRLIETFRTKDQQYSYNEPETNIQFTIGKSF